MPSDPSAASAPLARLADVLARAAGGVRPTPLELAELLWLARQLEPAGGEDGQPAPAAPESTSTADAEEERPDVPEPAPPRPEPEHPPTEPESPRAPLHLPAAGTPPGPFASLLAPAPPMLRHPLALQRALRPLKRRTDAPVGHRLDEHATADRIARLGAAPEWWLPVLRPARERWLRLNLVYDTGPTMPVWRPLIRELHTALAQSGVFRTVDVYRAAPDGTVRGDGAQVPADGRTVTLLVSDCMGPQWRAGEAARLWYGTLRRWAHRVPLAVVQPLPEHLWRDTALPAAPGLLSAPFPAAPAAALTFSPYEETEETAAADGAVPLPVLEPGPRWLANWAGLVASMGGARFPASAALLDGPLGPDDTEERTDVTRLSAEELVLRFRATASPEAFRLAGHLAVGRPDLPVMRLVQRAVEPDPRPQHLAEVILSGMLTATEGSPGSYAFRPGVRELLLRGLPRSARGRTTELLARVGELIEERAGAAPGEFHAVTPTESGADPAGAEADGDAFATVRPESVRQLSGGAAGAPAVPRGLRARYRLVRRIGSTGSVWQAEDTDADRMVVLRLHGTIPDAAGRRAFLRDAERLKALAHPNVVAVHDFGIEEDVPYVVMDHLEGIALNKLAAPNGYRLQVALTVRVGQQLALALKAVHDAGVTHGDLGMSRVMLLPDGEIRISLFAPGSTSGPSGQAEDLRALCEILLLLASGTSRPTVPLRPEQLGHLPASPARTYARALDLLMSRLLREQQRGRDMLTHRMSRFSHRPEIHRYRVLGPVQVEFHDEILYFSPLVRATLAILLLRHGRLVTHDELTRGLWRPGDAPHDAPAALARIVSRLRGALGPGVLATTLDGCALHTSVDGLDLVTCEELERQATTLAEQGDLAAARERIDRALALWDGPEALAEVPGPAARTARTRLLQLRLALHRKLAELDLDLGEYDRTSTHLTELLRSYPSREDFRRLLILALSRQGRGEEALEAFEEYELSGGRSPELLTLGRELREEYGEPEGPAPAHEHGDSAPDDFTAAFDEHSEGPFPTEDELPSIFSAQEDAAAETPLPQDDVPESLFAESVSDYRTIVHYDFADGPRDRETHAALGRAVARLLTASRLALGYEYELVANDLGYSVIVPAGVSARPLLVATVQQLPHRMHELDGARLKAVFQCVWADGWTEGPDEQRVRRAQNAADGIIAVPPRLRDELAAARGNVGPSPLAEDPADGFYCLVPVPPESPGSAFRSPLQGPFRLPPRAPLPEPAGRTRTVVYTGPDDALGLTRSPDATGYYEVDLTERRLELADSAPAADGVTVFEVTGEAVWRVTDPLEATAHADGMTPPVVLRNRLRSRLAHVVLNYPPTWIVHAEDELGAGPGEDAVPGCTVRWRLSLTTSRRPHPAPQKWRATDELVDALGRAEAVLFGFDGTLARLFPGSSATEAVRELLRGLDVLDAPSMSHPLQLLHAYQRHPAQRELRERLAALERAATPHAEPVPAADLLIRTLADRGKTAAVVTDCDGKAVMSYLNRRRLMACLPGGVHARDDGESRLMPDPHGVRRALVQLGLTDRRSLMIVSSRAAAEAAQAARIPFVRVGGGRAMVGGLVSDGLLPLLQAAQQL
ncbi:SAV_2336 N-terminal domain-related protein [Streptomyces sp. NPDC046915]|uniref:SAV_2336 N-terminal domain-related protein n=1 Tax=Streptomyces sp. NPDC046915 TaxID=3155257 RepID=UPI0033F64737